LHAAPSFSFVTATYQCARFLPRCHWSLTRQGVTDWEWVVVDDGSTDGTAEVIAGLGDTRIRYHRLPENCGRGVASDFALRQARGKWTAVMDADDLALPERLARAAEARAQGQEFFCSALALIDHDYGVTGVRGCAPAGYPRTFPHATLCGDTDLLRRIGYPGYRWAQDQTMVLTLANSRRGLFCDEALYLYHENASIRLRGAFLSQYFALKQLRALTRNGVLEKGPAVTRAQAARGAKLLGLLPFFLWPAAYPHTLRRRAKVAKGVELLPAETRNFIAECAQRFPLPARSPVSHGA
jgi:glycosyltransferase involved in cell wall biosynthesis